MKTTYSSVERRDVRKRRVAFFCQYQCEMRNISCIMELKIPCRPAGRC